MPQDLARIREAVDSGRKQALNASQTILEGMAASNDGWMSYYYAAQGVEQTTFKDNPKLQAALKEQLDKAQEVIRAEVSTSVIGIVDKNKAFHDLEDAYKLIVSDAASAMTSGEAYFDSVVEEATETLADSGLKVQYPNTYTVRESQGKGKPVKIITKTRETPLVRNLYSSVTSNVMNAYRVAMTDMRFIQGEEFGADAVRVSAHALCAPDHLPYQGNIYRNSEFQAIQNSLPRQLVYGGNCVVEGTSVDASGARAIFRRHYEGKVIRIRTGFGKNLTVTPNHPVFTMRGWINAKDIQKGDYVISDVCSDRPVNGARPYDQHQIATVEDCFSSFAHKFDIFSFTGTPADFHGDGIIDQQVDVIFIERCLSTHGEASFSQKAVQSLFHDAVWLSDHGFSLSTFAERFMGSLHSSDGIMGSSNDSTALLRSHAGIHGFGRFASGCGGWIAVSSEDFRDNHLMDSEFFSDMTLRHSSLVEGNNPLNVVFGRDSCRADSSLFEPICDDMGGTPHKSCNFNAGHSVIAKFDNVVDVEVSNFSGHVYNLSTNCGYYLANGIITHNCGHTVSPTIYDIAHKEHDAAYVKRLNDMSREEVTFKGLSGEKLTMTRYEASQYQRKLETQVRKSKETAYLLEIEGKSAADAAKAAREYTAAYNRISKEAGLSTRPERMKLYTSG